MIHPGDKIQLNEIRDQYNYLVSQKFELEELVIGKHIEQKSATEIYKVIARLTVDIKQIDEARFNLIKQN